MMKNIATAALFSLLSLGAFSAQANEQQGEMMHDMPGMQQEQVISGIGIVKGIDLAEKKMTIAHEAIPAVNWPPMTMRFTITDPKTQPGDIKVGDKVAFDFVQQGSLSLLRDIRISQ